MIIKVVVVGRQLLFQFKDSPPRPVSLDSMSDSDIRMPLFQPHEPHYLLPLRKYCSLTSNPADGGLAAGTASHLRKLS